MFRGDRDVPAGSCSSPQTIRPDRDPLTAFRAPLSHQCGRPTVVPTRCSLATTHGSATWPDALRPVHRHNEGALELPIGWRSSTIAVALRHMQQRAASWNECSLRVNSTVRPDPVSFRVDEGQGLRSCCSSEGAMTLTRRRQSRAAVASGRPRMGPIWKLVDHPSTSSRAEGTRFRSTGR